MTELETEIALARQTGEWDEVLLADVLDRWEELDLTSPEMVKVIEANPTMTLGHDSYELVHQQDGDFVYRAGQWSELVISCQHDVPNVVESHPY